MLEHGNTEVTRQHWPAESVPVSCKQRLVIRADCEPCSTWIKRFLVRLACEKQALAYLHRETAEIRRSDGAASWDDEQAAEAAGPVPTEVVGRTNPNASTASSLEEKSVVRQEYLERLLLFLLVVLEWFFSSC